MKCSNECFNNVCSTEIKVKKITEEEGTTTLVAISLYYHVIQYCSLSIYYSISSI